MGAENILAPRSSRTAIQLPRLTKLGRSVPIRPVRHHRDQEQELTISSPVLPELQHFSYTWVIVQANLGYCTWLLRKHDPSHSSRTV